MHSTAIFSTAIFTVLLASSASADNECNGKSCPGVCQINNANSGCCVGGHIDPPYLSVCPGWPVCSGPTTTTVSKTLPSCATFVPFTASNYDEQVSSASASLSMSGTNSQATAGGASAAAPTSGTSTGGSASTSAGGGGNDVHSSNGVASGPMSAGLMAGMVGGGAILGLAVMV